MLRSRAVRCKDGDDVLQRLACLGDEVRSSEFASLVPADLAGHEDLATVRRDAVGVSARTRPIARLKDPHVHEGSSAVRRRKRCSLPVSVFGNAATNSTRRGYLYGAMVAFTWSWMPRAMVSSPLIPGLSTTNAFTACPRSTSGTPTTAHSSTASCCNTAASTSGAPML